MNGTYFASSFKDKDRVKALGARWDPAKRQWYVPDGVALTPFSEWLPAGGVEPPTPSTALGGVAAAVSQAFRAGAWTLVEVVTPALANMAMFDTTSMFVRQPSTRPRRRCTSDEMRCSSKVCNLQGGLVGGFAVKTPVIAAVYQ